MTDIDYSGLSEDQLRHHLRNRDRQAVMTREYWLRDAKRALAGDVAALRNRVELVEMGPVTITNGDNEYTFPGYTPPVRDKETGWLIERRGRNSIIWALLTPDPDDQWTGDSSIALRFARKQDAQAYIDYMGWTEAVATEHEWSDSAPAKGG